MAQRRFSAIEAAVLHLQGGQQQPGVGQARLLGRQAFELHGGLWVALAPEQRAGVGHAGLGAAHSLEVLGDQGFGGAHAVFAQRQRQQHGAVGLGVELQGLAGCSQGAFLVGGGQAHLAYGGPGNGAQGGVLQLALQGLGGDVGRQGLVADVGVEPGDGGNGCGALRRRGLGQFLAQRLGAVAHAVEGNQNLQHEAVGIARLGLGAAPGLGGVEGGVA